MKGNAIGSIFYGVGFSTPGVLAEAFTGNDGTTTAGRRLLQDPYHLTSKVVPLPCVPTFSVPPALTASDELADMCPAHQHGRCVQLTWVFCQQHVR